MSQKPSYFRIGLFIVDRAGDSHRRTHRFGRGPDLSTARLHRDLR